MKIKKIMASHLSAKTFNFLEKLGNNNNRDWFNENKSLYNDAQQDLIEFLEELVQKISSYDDEITKTDVKKSLFRIYRDVRFSKDKSPYKTNFGASLGMGKGSQKAGYYLHIEPGKSFLAAGIYMPEPAVLKTIRKEISLFKDDFLKVVESENFVSYFTELDQESKLKNIPQGFEKEDPMGEFLKLKNFIVVYSLKDNELTKKDSVDNISKVFEAAKPLNDFFNSIISNP